MAMYVPETRRSADGLSSLRTIPLSRIQLQHSYRAHYLLFRSTCLAGIVAASSAVQGVNVNHSLRGGVQGYVSNVR